MRHIINACSDLCRYSVEFSVTTFREIRTLFILRAKSTFAEPILKRVVFLYVAKPSRSVARIGSYKNRENRNTNTTQQWANEPMEDLGRELRFAWEPNYVAPTFFVSARQRMRLMTISAWNYTLCRHKKYTRWSANKRSNFHATKMSSVIKYKAIATPLAWELGSLIVYSVIA